MTTDAEQMKIQELQTSLMMYSQRRQLNDMVLDMMIGHGAQEWTRDEISVAVTEAFAEYDRMVEQVLRMRAERAA